MMWRLGRRVRMGFSLILGVLAGVALLTIPALVSPTQQASGPETDDRYGITPSLANMFSPEPTTAPASTGTTTDQFQLALKLFLILIPASVLSVIARRLTVRKLEKQWYY